MTKSENAEPSEQPDIEVDDAIVLVLGAPSASPRLRNRLDGITRLEKLVFLLQQETDLGRELTEDPKFAPYNFGPFSEKIYQSIDILRSAGLLNDSKNEADSPDDAWEASAIISDEPSDPYTTRKFELTERGVRYYQALLNDLPPGSQDKLASFKDQFASIPLRQLVRYVYRRYPKMTEKSIIRNQVLG